GPLGETVRTSVEHAQPRHDDLVGHVEVHPDGLGIETGLVAERVCRDGVGDKGALGNGSAVAQSQHANGQQQTLEGQPGEALGESAALRKCMVRLHRHSVRQSRKADFQVVTSLRFGATLFFGDKDYAKSDRKEDLSVLTEIPCETLCPVNTNPADLPDSSRDKSLLHLHPYF